MFDIINLIVFVFYIITLSFTLSVYIRLYRRNQKTLASTAQLILDKVSLLNKIELMELQKSPEANENFIKFLSESREHAFSYIESVQLAVQNYLIAIENKDEEKIQVARIELFNHLPEEPVTNS
jgi:hypothetical protein